MAARLSIAATGVAATETYMRLTLSGFLAVSGLLFNRKHYSVFEGAKVRLFSFHARKL